jgi:PAS domain S-box
MARHGSILRIWGTAAFLALAGSAASTWQLWASRAAHLGAAEQLALSLSNATAQRVAVSLRSMDVMLSEAAEKVGDPARPAPALLAAMRAKLDIFPEMESMALIDANGMLHQAVYRGEQVRALPMDVSDRSHVRFQVESWRQNRLFISEPVTDRLSGNSVIILSRPIAGGGRFRGVAGMAVPTAFVDEALSSVIPAADAAAAFTPEGIVFSRQPAAPGLVGRSIAGSALFQAFQTIGGQGSVERTTSFADGVERVLGFTPVPNYPVVVAVGVNRDAVLGRWHREVWLQGGIQGVFVAVICVLALLLSRSERRRETLSGQMLAAERAHVESLAEAVEQRTAELNDSLEALAESEERFRRMVEISPLPLVLTRLSNSRVVYINGCAAEAFGVAGEDVIDAPAPDYWERPEERERMRRVLAAEGHVRNLEAVLKRANGERFTALLSAATVTLRGEDMVLASVLDITERKRLEQELARSNRDLEQFSYAVSHDLQEPLRMVSSYLALLERRYRPQLDATAHEFIGFAVDGAQRMSRMITDLLEYSRVHRRGNPLAPVALDTVLADALANLSTAAADCGARIETQPLPMVSGDASQLMRVFQNLIGNALKYRSPERPPRVAVSAERAGGFWVVSVEDNGIGIAPEDTGRLFQVFQRLHARGAYEGTGVGLALCRRILERHGGRIWVDSPGPDQGSTFRFALPAQPAAESPAQT